MLRPGGGGAGVGGIINSLEEWESGHGNQETCREY
jgi:hypothetical protein